MLLSVQSLTRNSRLAISLRAWKAVAQSPDALIAIASSLVSQRQWRHISHMFAV